jgi:hypothetical protein
VTGRELAFFSEVVLDGVDEDEFFAAAALVVKPAPFELAVVAEVVDGLDAAGDEGGGLGDADPGGGSLHAEADFAVDGRGKHFEEPLLLENGGQGCGGLPFWGWVEGAVHREESRRRLRRVAIHHEGVWAVGRGLAEKARWGIFGLVFLSRFWFPSALNQYKYQHRSMLYWISRNDTYVNIKIEFR